MVEQGTQVVTLYQAREKIQPRTVKGVFSNWRWAMVWITQIVFYGLPWLMWGHRHAVLFDLDARRFYIFNLILYPQDFIYLTGLLIIAALALFLFTAIAGRLWCGFACPQTVYTEIFMWFERVIEGDRGHRLRLDQAKWSASKLIKRLSKHAVWLAFSLWTGISFVGYFSPIQDLLWGLWHVVLGPWEWFWILFYGFATYGNAGFLREQVCKYMCPYARFQGVMFDADTLIISYDEARGEPRGKRSKRDDPTVLSLGHCIDCTICVQVCPTGIDIRDGLQYECIGCAACIDACDDVMDQMGYPRGLVRYSTGNAMARQWGMSEILKHIRRPRVVIYSVIFLSLLMAVALGLYFRQPLKMDVIRDRGVMSRLTDDGRIGNVYSLQIMNAEERTREYAVSVSGLSGIRLGLLPHIMLGPAEARMIPIEVTIPPDTVKSGLHSIFIDVRSREDEHVHVTEEAKFFVPR